MYSLLLLISIGAFYCFYLASAKTKIFSSSPISQSLKRHPATARTLGYILLVGSWVIFANLQGLGAGSFASITYFMGFGSIVTILNPYRYLRLWHMIIILGLFGGIELWLF